MVLLVAICPRCGQSLKPVEQESGALNDDQFDAIKAGDWYCEHCKGSRGKTGYRYYWDRELQGNTTYGNEVSVECPSCGQMMDMCDIGTAGCLEDGYQGKCEHCDEPYWIASISWSAHVVVRKGELSLPVLKKR